MLIGLDRLLELKSGRDNPVLCVDSDNFYTMENMLAAWGGKNCVFSFVDEQPNPVFSYVQLAADSDVITAIKEKEKISDLANCGAVIGLFGRAPQVMAIWAILPRGQNPQVGRFGGPPLRKAVPAFPLH